MNRKIFCCNSLEEHVCSNVSIRYIPKFREFGIVIDDGGSAMQVISFCPWCGAKLPNSLRDKWFDIVFDDLGFDAPDSPGIPSEMHSDEWWITANDQ